MKGPSFYDILLSEHQTCSLNGLVLKILTFAYPTRCEMHIRHCDYIVVVSMLGPVYSGLNEEAREIFLGCDFVFEEIRP